MVPLVPLPLNALEAPPAEDDASDNKIRKTTVPDELIPGMWVGHH